MGWIHDVTILWSDLLLVTLFKCQPIQEYLLLQELLIEVSLRPDLQDKSEDKSVPEQPCVNPLGARLEKELLEWKAARLMPEGPSMSSTVLTVTRQLGTICLVIFHGTGHLVFYERFVLSYGLRAEKNKMSPCHECWAHLQFPRTRYEAAIGGESNTGFDMNLYQCMPSWFYDALLRSLPFIALSDWHCRCHYSLNIFNKSRVIT